MASVSAGDVVAEKYRVERLLGRGGMGYVVAARHLTLDQLVAIKFLRRSALSDEEALARFRREAKACVRLKNEHVAKVFDVGVHGEEPFIVMEHLEGADLGALAKANSGDGDQSRIGRTFPIGTTCDYIIQACEALAEAHALGIVHRDIKLPNLFLTHAAAGQGLLKVLDFGVSKILAEHETSLDVTTTAAVLGSPKYMSPEQMNDPRSVDGRTDIWSLGICLYRLLSGHAPYDGDTIGRLCTMVLHERPIPLTDLRPDVPAALEAVVMCCLQKDRAFRFANVAELAASLAVFASEPERAAERVHHIASVLGVPSVPLGYLPALPAPTPQFHMTTGPALEGAAAWAHTMVAEKEKRRRSDLTLALAAGSLLFGLTVVGIAVALGPRGSSSAASQPTTQQPPPALTPTTPLIVYPTTPSVPATIVATSTATTTTTTTTTLIPTTPTTTTTTTTTRRGGSGGGGATHGRPNGTRPSTPRDPDDARTDTGPLPIPGDRK